MISENLRFLRSALPEGVRLVAVSKFHPVERIREAYEAGQRVFAESRPQELVAKVPQLPSDIEWHFIGHLQTNKLKLVLPHVALVQSVDSLHLLEAIDRWGAASGRVIDILLEVHIASDTTKQGFSPEEIAALLLDGEGVSSGTCATAWYPKKPCFIGGPTNGTISGRGREATSEDGQAYAPRYENIRIRGLMGMATLTEDESVIEGDFRRIETLYNSIRAAHPEWTCFDQLSIGMSGDWPIAVRHGATMVRIGTDIFGPREY